MLGLIRGIGRRLSGRKMEAWVAEELSGAVEWVVVEAEAEAGAEGGGGAGGEADVK